MRSERGMRPARDHGSESTDQLTHDVSRAESHVTLST
jgi:hypothetical protein